MKNGKLIKVLIGGTVGTLVVSTGVYLGKKYKLQKEYRNYKFVEIYEIPSNNVENVKIDRDNISEMIIGEEILNFIDVLGDKIPNSFYKNLESIRIIHKDFRIINFLTGDKFRACYNPEVNIMLLEDLKSKFIIIHELFHVAVSFIGKNNVCYSGFLQRKDGKCVGKGLNEGYTQLSAERYFGVDENDKNTYTFEKLVVSLLEDIVGVEKMERLYFKSDLFGLVSELLKYNTEDEILNFIHNVDFYCDNSLKFGFINSKLALECLNDIGCFLFKTFYSKLILEPENVDVNLIDNFLKILMSGVSFEKKIIKYFDIEDEARIIDELSEKYVLEKKRK